jgi:PAS domain S-box-containing protein
MARTRKEKKKSTDAVVHGRPPAGIDISTMRTFLESLLRNMQGGVFTVNMDRRITSFNKAAEWITGYCLDDVLGQECARIFRSSICEDSCPFSKSIKKDAPVYKSDVEIVGKDDRRIPVSLTCFPLKNFDGVTVGLTVIFRDITELKTLRGQLMQSEKLAIMGQLAAGVAHEVNNPISGILTYIKLMARKLEASELDSSLTKEFSRYLSILERETSNVGRIVRNLLDFSRRSEPDIGPVDMTDVIEQSLLLVRDQLTLGNIEVKREGTEQLPEIMGDFGQLQQVLVNLIINARQAMPEGGRLAIETEAEGSPGRACFVKIVISDTGHGISEENLRKIFDPFFSTKGGTDGTSLGLGLGLSIVQGIIKSHHGHITVKSKVGKGSVFTVRLPTR